MAAELTYSGKNVEFLGHVVELRKATVSFIMSVCLSVCLSVWNNSALIGRFFIKINI